MEENLNNIVSEPSNNDLLDEYKQDEINSLKEALQRSHLERFLFATRLYKIQKTLQKAQVTHQPFLPK